MRGTMRGACLIVLLTCALSGQQSPAVREFEVASVKALEPPYAALNKISSSGPRLNMEGVNLRLLLRYAYNLKNYQISAKTIDDTFYDVIAKAEGDVAPTNLEFRQMAQSLLADRFKLRAHREMQETPVYELVPAGNGSRLKQSGPEATAGFHVGVKGRDYQVTSQAATMPNLIEILESSGFLDRPILDKTGLTGTYDIKLTYTPELRSMTESDPNDTSIFAALRQLGLKLQPQKAMFEVLVVDHAEKPSPN